MTMTATVPATRFDRIVSRTPILAPLARAIGQDVTIIYYLLAILATGVVLAVKTFGLVALVMTYLALVPLMFVFFISITWP
ncbi:hypothetical protein [Cypionkella sp.]|jgi:hypothetical protein|uniref:hypothetical protein n=1 Tax=Cypionkella sp. TaxID=2811411 RepID=UPI003753BDD8